MGKPEVFISYARKVEDDLIDRLDTVLQSDGRFEVRRDQRELSEGELISAYMERLGHGQLVVLVLSQKYFHSQYCMRELLYVFRGCMEADHKLWKESFRQRVIPVLLPQAPRIDHIDVRNELTKHWNEHREKYVATLHAAKDAVFEEFKFVRTLCDELTNLLAMLGDILGADAEADDRDAFGRVRDLIVKRLALPEPAPVDWKARLDRLPSRRMVRGVLDERMMLGPDQSKRASGFVLVGSPANRPELLGQGLCNSVRPFLNADVVELFPDGLPKPTLDERDRTWLRDALIEKICAEVSAHGRQELRRKIRDLFPPPDSSRPRLLWIYWGTYPEEGHHPRTPEEIALWFASLRDHLLDDLPQDVYLVSVIGVSATQEDSDPNKIHQKLKRALKERYLSTGEIAVAVLRPLGAVPHDELLLFLEDEQSIFGTRDPRVRDECANLMVDEEDEVPFPTALQFLEALEKLGPAQFTDELRKLGQADFLKRYAR